ncbi:putative xyloglucan-specific endo-beta- -glucanase precursor protein [Phaeoacremonium minimum UCRPA7]|uniref:Putative xyloglucan-specific endo-beta--glucanase protein n=1 Tax=Phaeoacremonium minimum (strain UCR-PA7) TaxID=1286976 RepID=R8BAK2_PHAM7|nr:putative xyloglucan-specific endo-beta- -glucanase precursor protein [Phaeoacremonium minimum UCRPA7]EON96324.1 putative xyloglucan-specific endo-beta- -glucanase precursor protein [Phaeoacremonium minimum UCRPA7]
MKLSVLAPGILAGLAAASPAPTKSLQERATTMCGQWDSLATGGYTVYQDLWGMSAATSGSQCTTVTGMSGSNLVWSTSWTWAGGSSSVKSYANAVVSFTPKQLSAISKIPTTWKWSYTGTSVVANVAYDLFTGSSASGTSQYEIMIWLNALGGAGPISSTGSTIATPTIGGVSWKLYSGSNGVQTVFSFVASSAQSNFSGDLKNFISYLTSNQGLPTSQYLTSIGAGTETFTGSNAVFSTSAYTASVS